MQNIPERVSATVTCSICTSPALYAHHLRLMSPALYAACLRFRGVPYIQPRHLQLRSNPSQLCMPYSHGHARFNSAAYCCCVLPSLLACLVVYISCKYANVYVVHAATNYGERDDERYTHLAAIYAFRIGWAEVRQILHVEGWTRGVSDRGCLCSRYLLHNMYL